MERHIAVPFSEEELKELHAGDYIYLTGTIYSARDAAHKRMYDAICVELTSVAGFTGGTKGIDRTGSCASSEAHFPDDTGRCNQNDKDKVWDQIRSATIESSSS